MAERRGSLSITLIVVALVVSLGVPPAAAASPQWVNTGPLGAPIYDLELSAGHPSTLYAMSTQVVYRSDDRGSSWVPRPTDLYNGPAATQTLAVSAQQPNVAYIHDSSDLEKTTDGGKTWVNLTGGLPSSPYIKGILVDPTNDQVAYVGGNFLVFKTVDGGATWMPAYRGISGSIAVSMAIDPVDPSVLFMYSASGALVYKTVDGGSHWFGSGAGLPVNPPVGGLAVDPNDDQHVFALVGSDVYRSTDGGANWMPSTSGVAPASLLSLAVSKADPDTVYAGLSDLYNAMPRGVFKSTDAGQTWRLATHAFKGSALAVDPTTPGVIYAATGNYQHDDLGVLGSTDGGELWKPRNGGILGTDIDALAAAPSDGRIAYAATDGDPGLYRTIDGGRSWTFAARGLPSSATAIAVSTADPQLVYAGLYADEPLATHAGVYKSFDGGRTWQPANAGIEDRSVLTLVADPSNQDVLYAGVVDYCGSECDGGSLRKSTDGGATWTVADHDVGLTPTELAISNSDPQTLYYVDSSLVVRTQDGGENWVQVARIPVEIFDTAALVVDPGDSATVYAGGWGGIAKTTDSGVTWSMLPTAPDPVNGLTTPSPGEICAATSKGVSCSIDGGASWAKVRGLRAQLSLVAAGSGGHLYAGTYAHGVAARRI